MGPTLWEQAPKQARKHQASGSKPLSRRGSEPGLWEQAPRRVRKGTKPLRKLPKAYSLALATHRLPQWFCST